MFYFTQDAYRDDRLANPWLIKIMIKEIKEVDAFS